MPRQIDSKIEIEAAAGRVWSILTDFSQYPDWNPFVFEIKGAAVEGTRIRFWFELPRGFRAPARATILKVAPEREMRWAGGVRGLFRAEHYMLLDSRSESSVLFRHGEIFTGALVALLWPILARSGPSVYEETNVALKKRAESRVRAINTEDNQE